MYELQDYGVYVGPGNDGTSITDNQINVMAGFYEGGIYDYSSTLTISGNTISNAANAGILGYVGKGTLITGNNIFDNTVGINLDTTTITQNIVHDNSDYGINATTGTLVTGNTVYNNHGTSFEAGIVVTGGVASGNVAFGNGWGIIAETGSTSGNLVYGNIYGGAEVYNGASFSDNVVEGNSGYGIFLNLSYYGAPGGALTNNVVYGNAGGGLDVSNATGFLIQNNTVYQTSGDALDITSAYYGLTLRDNIFWATSGADINISAQAQPAVTSDYNDLYFSSSGVLGISNGVSYFTLLDWTNATGFDVDSISADPLFVNIAGNDFHEQSQFGTYQGGSLAVVLDNETGLPTPVTATLTDYSNQSPVIDAGAPTDAFNLEPTPNGGYDNIGAYGDSPQASLSPTEYLNVLQPHAGQTLATGQTYTILWRTQDNGGTVEIDLLNDQNQLIETIAGAAANSGSFAWSVPTALSSGNYSIRITRSDGAGVGQGSVFILATSTGIYYVNDAIVTAGDWTTAPGNNANSGLDPAHPKASISAILAAYQLSPGNIIMVDDGTYNLTNNITIPSADSGIIIEGFTNSSGVLLTTLNRQNISAGAYAFSLTGATNVTIENFEIINSYAGVVANDNSGSTGLTVTGLNIHLFYQVGVYIGSGNNGATIDDNSIHDGSFPGVDYYGIQTVSSDVTITNNTIYDSDMYGIYMQGGSQSLITNNQIYNNSTGIYADTATISGNTVHDNANSGINGSSSLIIGNTVYNNFGGGNQAGIFAQNSTANNNVAYANVNGIDVSSSTASNNRVYDNSTYGMIVQFGTATGNFIYSNGGGIFGTGIPVLLNNLIYDNSSFGILIQSVPNATVLGNTIYQPTGDGIQVVPNFFITTSSIFVEDNIIWTMQGRDFLVPDFQSSAVYSNYNDLYATGTGEIGNFGGEDFATLAAWTTELGLDRNSISSDPQFANIGGIDGQVGFVNGVDHGVDDNFNVQSTSATIDAGDPSQSYSAEPSPNGGRINLGYTGGTAQATHSAAQTIQVISPAENSRAQQGQTVPITWNSAGLTDPNPNNAYTQAALSENPLVYLKLDETSGTTAVDSSGNGLNGVYVDGPTLGLASVFGSGQGSAVGFNGGTDTVTVSSTALDLTETVTLSAWIKPTAFATTWQPIFYKGVGDYMHRTYTVWLNSSGYILLDSFDGSNERTLASPSGSVPLNVWTHIAVVMDRSTGTAEIYINGALAASAAPGAFPEVPAQDSAAEPLYIGYTPENSPQFGIFRYTGEIDEAAVFNTALTAAQVNAQYNAGKGSFHIDLLNSSGTVVQSIATSVYGTSFNWTIPTSLAPGMYQVRVTSDLTGAAAGTSQPLMVVSAGHSYYVNDGSLTGDATDTAVGNNANDGKSPSTPMASIEAVINTYHPGAGDTIFVENGTYSILQNITIYAADSGLTIQGPAANGTVATINRGNTSDYDFIFQDGTHNITIDHLTLTGALDAIFAPDESYGAGIKNITVSNNVIFGNIEAGVSIATNDTGWLITGNTIHDNNGSGGYVQDGIYASGTSATVTNNTVYNQVQYGIYVQGPAGSIISGNTVYTNAYGIDATNATINNNLAHDNTIDGICVDSGSLAIGNTAWRQTAYGAAGFRVSSGELRGNAAYGNYNGIYIDGSYAGTTDDNRVYSNTNYGIYIYGSGYDHIFNNLVYNNSNGGIYAYDTFAGASIINNTVYQPVNDAINLAYSYNDSIENNILWVEAGYDIDVTDGTSQNGLVSDFNLLHAGTGANAHVGFWNGAAQTQLADWQAASGMDTHSAAADPLFVSTSGVDGVQGYNSTANNGQGFDGGADDNFFLSAASPAIGIGNPAVAPSTDLIGQSRQTPAGPVDVGAYAFTGTSNDTTPPNIVATTPAGINSSGQVTSLSSITVTFNEPINPIDASAVAEYDLRSAGPDGLFNTGDDVVYPITPTYTPGNTFVTLNFAGGPLPYGTYRLEIFGAGNATIHDLSGLALAGGNYVRTFTIAAASPLTLSGTAEYLKLDADGQHIDIWSNSIPSGMMTQYLLSSVSSVTYDGTGIFVLDFSAGDPLPASGLDFAATGSQNTLEIIGTSSNDNIVVAAGSVMFNSIPIAFTNAQTLIIDPGMGADSLAVNAGTVTLPAGAVGGGILTRHFASLSIANGATVLVTHANTSTDCTVLVTDSLSIAGTGKLDLSNNDMLIHGGSDIFSQLTSQLLTGFNGGQWTGVSIASSAATNSTTLGIELNDDGTTNHGVLLNSFDGQNNLVNTDLLIKYTYFGDADLSGTVTAADYLLIDNGFNNGGVGWHNGDFNYDGVINGDDYTLIDNAYNSQGSVSFAAAPASQIATDAPQVVVASKVSTFAMSGIAEVRQFVAVVANPLTGDNTDTQELKKRRLGVWEMLKA
jgi:parallel beta-helix repeat protein